MKIYFLFILIILSLTINSQDIPHSVGPAPQTEMRISTEPAPFAVGSRAFTQISSSPTFQFGKSFLEGCTITNIGAPFTITFPGGLVYRNGLVYTWNQSSPYQLWQIDTVTGTHTLVFNMTGVPQANFTGMCYDGTTLYGISTSITQSQIFSINTTTGVCTPIGSASSLCAGAINLMGRIGTQYSMFVCDIVADNLYKVDKTTGVFTLVGPLGANANFGQDGCVDPNDNAFYWMAYTTGPQLRKLDTTNGSSTLLCSYLAQATGIACPFSGPPPPPLCYIYTTICRSGLNVVVPDNNPAGVRDTIRVLGCSNCTVCDINIKIDSFYHTWDSDMIFTLTHNLTTVNLITNRGSSGDNFLGTILNDSAAVPISSGSAPFTGSFRPEQPLSAFNTIYSPQGTWILFMADNAPGDTGFLKGWCLIFGFLPYPPIGINITQEIPFTYRLSQNYPNPFNPTTTIKYGLPKYGKTSLIVYDVLGKIIATLVDNELKDAGTYEVQWDASGFSSGIYFYTLESGTYKETKKMILIK